MTEDERMEFLRQSIESHDRQLGELAERMDNAWAYLKELNQTVDKLAQTTQLNFDRLDRLAQTTQLNFDRLTKAMTGLTDHVVDHQHRLEALESNRHP
jgi:ABC-type transporter Mla subunit MlaD